MFKACQEIYLGSTSGDQNSVFGKYQQKPDDGSYLYNDKKVFVQPELAEINKIQILHFPAKSIKCNETVEFIVKKNNARGNIEAKITIPTNITSELPLQILDPDRFAIKFFPKDSGLYQIHIRLNGVEIPSSPFITFAVQNDEEKLIETTLPVFTSDASLVKYRGVGLKQMVLNEKNEFTIDASSAGTNIVFIGICGPKGQSDEVSIKHLGENIYNVNYRVQDRGQYVVVVKWGDEQIPDSPFHLECI